MAMLPKTLLAADGAKVAFTFVLCPGTKIVPLMSAALNPGPEIVTVEIVTSEFPKFVKAMVKLRLPPTLTLPKFRLDELTISCENAAELMVRVSVLLVSRPVDLSRYVAVKVCIPTAKVFVNKISSTTGRKPQFIGKPPSKTHSCPVGIVVPG